MRTSGTNTWPDTHSPSDSVATFAFWMPVVEPATAQINLRSAHNLWWAWISRKMR